MQQRPREELGNVFSDTIDLHAKLYPDQIAELIARAAGENFHKVHYHHGYDRYVLGRRAGHGLGGDFIVTQPPTTAARDYDMLWNLGSRVLPCQSVVVFDGHWNDGLIRRPLSRLSFPKKNDLIIEEGSKFVERLQQEADNLARLQ
jgi:hypothetical protein